MSSDGPEDKHVSPNTSDRTSNNDNLCPPPSSNPDKKEPQPTIEYVQYSLAHESTYLPQIRDLISHDLSEPYSIYVYRYFLYQWPSLCYMALLPPTTRSNNDPGTVTHSNKKSTIPHDDDDNNHRLIGVVISKLEPRPHTSRLRGYIAMLATSTLHRNRGIATTLVSLSIDLMIKMDADEVALETEEGNHAAMKLYERLGFLRTKKLWRYYLNGNSAFRLVLPLKEGVNGVGDEDDGQDGQEEMKGGYGELPPSAGEERGNPLEVDELYSRGVV